MKRIGVTDDAISIFQVAFLDEMRLWTINQPIMGANRWAAVRGTERQIFDDKSTAQFYVQQCCIRAGLVTLMGQENVMELLPIIDVPETP
ncbi:MAG: hypothetical protein ACXW13_00020 [Burkholderiaceae bacterium]